MKPEVQQPRLDVLGISIVLILLAGILAISAILMLTHASVRASVEVPADAPAAPNFIDSLQPSFPDQATRFVLGATEVDGKLVIAGRCVRLTIDPDSNRPVDFLYTHAPGCEP